jgi:predicted phosphodiesterase
MTTTIAHISDLHLSSDDAWNNFQALTSDILELNPKPSLIIASGDFLDHPDSGVFHLMRRVSSKALGLKVPKTFTDIQTGLIELCRQCGDCQLVVVPGNHDYRQFGLTSWSNQSAGFEKVFTGWREPLMLLQHTRPVAIFTLDSNTNDARVNAARGYVGKEEYLRLRNEFKKLKEASSPEVFDQAFKIVVLHHHPLPIADSEEAGYWTTDRFLGLDDAGIFMREMAILGVDLVLHGHKHHPFNARVEVRAGPAVHDLTILAAGSACISGSENSFNVITLEPHAVSAQLRVRKTGVAFIENTSFPILNYEKFRDWAFQAFVDDPATIHVSERLVLTYSVLEYGDADVSNERRGLRCASPSKVGFFPVRLECPHGTFADYRLVTDPNDMIDVGFEADEKTKDGLVSGRIVFDPPIDSKTEEVDYEESYRLYNAFALTPGQRFRMNGEDTPEWVGVRFKNPVRKLVINVHFAGIDLPSSIRPAVYGADRDPELEELRWCKPNLHISKLAKTATLTVSKPRSGLSYCIEWDLPPDPRSQLSAERQGQCAEIRSRLLELDTKSLALNSLSPVFGEKHKRLAKEFHTPLEKLHLGLMVYDPTANHLRYVAGVMEAPYWNYSLLEGQGVAGRAHKVKFAQIYPRGVQPRMAFAAAPPAGQKQSEILICVPLLFPVFKTENNFADEVIGVMTLSSTYQATELLKIDGNRNLQEAITLEFQIFLLTDILPALGLQRFVDSAVEK